MSTFSQVYKPYFQGEGGTFENQNFFSKLLTFLPDFYYFHGDFCHSINVDVYSFFWGGGGGAQKVYGLYTHENVDIYGLPLNLNIFYFSKPTCYFKEVIIPLP